MQKHKYETSPQRLRFSGGFPLTLLTYLLTSG